MKIRSQFLSLVITSVAFMGLQANAEERLIRFGSDASYPPFEYTTPSGEIVGLDIDLAKAMCAKMNAKCTFQNQSWDVIIPALRTKKFDVIASSMKITPERQKAVAFTDKIWSTPNVLIAKKGTDIDTTKEDTKGKEIGIQQGTIQDKYATKHFTDAKIRRYKTFEDALNDLNTGRVGSVFADGGVAAEFIKSDAGKDYAIVGTPIQHTADPEIFGPGTGFAVRKGDTKLLEDLNKALKEVRAEGSHHKINDKYFDFNVFTED